MEQKNIAGSREVVSLVECCVLLKMAIQPGISEQVHCHGEFVACWITTLVAVYDTLYHGIVSELVNTSAG